MLAIIFALGSLLCGAVNDSIFKLYSAKKTTIGLYLSFIGLVWAVVFSVVVFIQGGTISSLDLFWGVVSGVFSILANILLVEGMKGCEAGVASTIYRLNLVPAALFAMVFMGESYGVFKISGILFALIAVLLFFPGKEQKESLFSVALVVAGALLRAAMGISYKVALNHHATEMNLLVVNGVCWLVGGVLYFLIREKSTKKHFFRISKYGLWSGLFVCGIVVCLMLALKHGEASIVLPISQMSFLGTAVIAALFLHEKLSPRKKAGVGFAILCIILMALA